MFTLRDLFNRSLLLVAMAATAAGMANATPVFSTTVSLTVADPTQSTRLFRTGLGSEWSTQKAYPGTSGAGPIHYRTLDLDISALEAGYTSYGQFLQIDIDYGTSSTTFLGAYLDSYNPLNLGTNYLGDVGSSGNAFGNPQFFQVSVLAGHHLMLVFNETGASTGLNQAANVLVEAFTDTEFTDLTPRLTVPEPATFELALLVLAGIALRRKVKARSLNRAPLQLSA